MMVGHAALAFALGAGVAVALGVEREQALLFAVTAGAFGAVPDVDIGYAVVGLFADGGFDPGSLPDVFWETGNLVHRGLTHSFVVGSLSGLLFGLVTHRRLRPLAVAGLAGLVLVATALLGAVWLAVLAYAWLRDRSLRQQLHSRAALGTGYAGAVVLLPLPTLAASYQFVFGALALGATVALAGLPAVDLRSTRAREALLVTGLATVTLAWLAYLVTYLFVS